MQKTLALHIAYSFSKEKFSQVCTGFLISVLALDVLNLVDLPPIQGFWAIYLWCEFVSLSGFLFRDSSVSLHIKNIVSIFSQSRGLLIRSIFAKLSFSVVKFLSSSSIWRIRLPSFDISWVEYWTEEQTTWCGFLKRKIDVDICRNHKLLFYQGEFKSVSYTHLTLPTIYSV